MNNDQQVREAWPETVPPEIRNNPLFEVIWSVIKTWDINVPDAYSGYCSATGSHVAAILQACEAHKGAALASAPEAGKWKSLAEWYETFTPIDEYHEDDGNVLWWRVPVEEPPYCGKPDDSDWKEGYYTHFTPLVRNSVLRKINESTPPRDGE